MTEKTMTEKTMTKKTITKTSASKKCFLKYGIILFGVLLLIYTAYMAVLMNYNAGLAALGLVSLAFIIYGVLWDKLKKAKWLHITVIALCLILIIFSSFLALYGNSNNVSYDEDAIIVLGTGIRGEEVTRTLGYRLDKAVEYHQKNPTAFIVVSGGQGAQEDITEALAMERYLIERGVPAEKIIKEEKSTSTYENFSFSIALLKKRLPDGFSVAFITNDFHVYRAEGTAQCIGFSVRHIGAPIDWYTAPVVYIREMAAVLKFWIFPPKA